MRGAVEYLMFEPQVFLCELLFAVVVVEQMMSVVDFDGGFACGDDELCNTIAVEISNDGLWQRLACLWILSVGIAVDRQVYGPSVLQEVSARKVRGRGGLVMGREGYSDLLWRVM